MDAKLAGTMWRDDMWLTNYPLNVHTALDYFSCSPFWDAGCNNVRARLEQKNLRDLQGVEFGLDMVQEPHLFVISKHQRQSQDSMTPLMFFYILDGSIYQTPTLHALLHARLSRSIYQIKHAFTRLQSDLDPMRKAVPPLGNATEKPAVLQTPAEPSLTPCNSEWQPVDPHAIGRILSHVVRKIVAVTFCNIHSTDAECCETGRRDAEHKYALIRAVRLSFASSQGKYARGQQRSRSVIVVSCQGQCALACSVGTQLSRTYLKLLATRPCHILAIAMLACMSVGMHAMVLT